MASIDQSIEELKRKSIRDVARVLAPSDRQIADAETQLGITFPPTFLVFLREAGGYQLPYWETFWVGNEDLGYRNIVKANLSEREEANSPLPEFLIAFHNNGCGDFSCFDVRNRQNDGEYPIVFWDHELSSAANLEDLGVVANSFAEWLGYEVEASQ